MTAQGVEALCEEGGLRVRLSMAQGGSGAAFFQVANFLAYGLLGRLGAPVYALGNVLGLLANVLVRDTRFALNHACLAVAEGGISTGERRVRPKHAAFGRFLVVGGGIAAASALAIAAIVAATGWDPIVAAAIVAVAGNVIGFVATGTELPRLARPSAAAVPSLRHGGCGGHAREHRAFAFFTRTIGMHYLVASLAVSGVFAVTNSSRTSWSFAPRRGPGRSA